MIDPACLQALTAVDDHETVGAAARALGYTPSAVSQRIKRLEKQVGVPLLHPAGRNVVLTGAGRALVQEGRDLLSRWTDLENRTGLGAERPTGLLRIGAFPTALRGLLVPALERLRHAAPDLHPQVHECDVQLGIEAVRAGRYDACIIHGWHGLAAAVPADLQQDELGLDRADVLLPTSHPLASANEVSARDLLNDTWVVQPPGTICHRWFLHMFAGIGRTPRDVWEVAEYETQIELVRRLGATALVPRLAMTADRAGLAQVPVTAPVPMREISLIVRRGLRATPTHAVLLDCLRSSEAVVAQLPEEKTAERLS